MPPYGPLMAVLAVFIVLPIAPALGEWTPTRPNFVFVLTDDQRYDSLGCTGHPVARTPHIDRIAREGMLFANCFVSTPLCSPSRASFLTGLYAHSHRVINNDRPGNEIVGHTLYTFPRRLREAGVRVDAVSYGGMIHGFAPMGRLIETGNRAVAHVAASLRQALAS